MNIWQQYRGIAHIFKGWGPTKSTEVIAKLNEFCAKGVPLEKHSTWSGFMTLSSPSWEIQLLLNATETNTYMALRAAVQGYERLAPAEAEELLSRKIQTRKTVSSGGRSY